MKTTTRIIATLILAASLFTSTAFAGDQPNGSLVDSPAPADTVTKAERKLPFVIDTNFAVFLRDFFSKIFG